MDMHRIQYAFRLSDGSRLEFPLEFEKDGFNLKAAECTDKPDWTKLDNHMCEHCPLDVSTSPHCPLAVSLVEVIGATSKLVSHEKVEVEVTLPGRKVNEETTAADGLRSLMGLIIPTSGCPHTAFFKPMARFHLPFSDENETLYRVCSMYLLAQNMRGKNGLEADAGFEGLTKIYANINKVNLHVADRIREASKKDSTANALVLLDVFAQLLPMQFDEALEEILTCFEAYLS